MNTTNLTTRLHEEKLPSMNFFFASIQDRECATSDNEFAIKVWTKRGCNNGEDYCKMYLASNVLTSLDTVCKNTGKIYQKFGSNFGYYCSAPHLVMDLILKFSKGEIVLIIDMDQHLFVEIWMSVKFYFLGQLQKL